MKLFLGYDPGGEGKHGVAAAYISKDGTFSDEPKTETLADANEVIEWFHRHSSVAAFGVDTLLAWSATVKRVCDDALRSHYQSSSVVAQNSLYSAMTINGIIVAQDASKLSLPLVESHPGVVINNVILKQKDSSPGNAAICERYEKLRETKKHAADALVAAWCASQWIFGHWKVNLYEVHPNKQPGLIFPAGKAVYPWPENILRLK